MESISVGLNENATSIIATNNASESSNLISTTELTTTKKTSNEKQVIDYSEDYPVKQVERCYFAEDITNASIEILSKRCQRAISGKVIEFFYRVIEFLFSNVSFESIKFSARVLSSFIFQSVWDMGQNNVYINDRR